MGVLDPEACLGGTDAKTKRVLHKTDGHPGPSPAPTALAATSYTEQGAARDQPRTCTRLPPAANLRGVRREEAAGQDTRPRGDELGSGDVDVCDPELLSIMIPGTPVD